MRVHWPTGWARGEPDAARLLASVRGALTVRASSLTRNVLVEFDPRVTDADAVVAAISGTAPRPAKRKARAKPRLERPDPATLELVVNGARLAGASVGLAIVAARRGGRQSLPGARTASGVGAAVSVIDGFPELRAPLDRALGPAARTAAVAGTALLAHTLSGSVLGLAVSGVIAARQLTAAHARRAAAARFERVEAGSVGTYEDGEQVPLPGEVVHGEGTALAADGIPEPVAPGARIAAGTRLFGGRFTVALDDAPPAQRGPPPQRDPAPAYTKWMGATALVAAGATFLLTRSLPRAVGVLLLLNPRPGLLGEEGADAGAVTRVCRSGALPLGTGAVLSRPTAVVVGAPRLLVDGLEVADVDLLDEEVPREDALALALSVAGAAGSPWGPIRARAGPAITGEGRYAGGKAIADLEDGETYTLAAEARQKGRLPIVLRRGAKPLARIVLVPRLAAEARELEQACTRHDVELRVAGEETTRLPDGAWYVTDSFDDEEALERADTVVGIGRTAGLPADLLAPELATVAALLDAAARRDLAVRDGVLIAVASHVFGALWIARGAPPHTVASIPANVATLASLAAGWLRLAGGEPSSSAAARLVDPRPERWGRRSVEDVLRTLATSERGLTSEEAASRLRRAEPPGRPNPFRTAVVDQLRSPLTTILAGGAVLSLATGVVADVVLIGSVIALNAALAAVQERQVGEAAAELERMGRPSARVLRDGRRRTIAADELVPGDILLLASGDRAAADARVVRANGLEVDEAVLTGESFPVGKRPAGGDAERRVVLAGTDVAVGSGRAVVVAVGDETRFGATAAALAAAGDGESRLGRRLQRMLVEVMPVVVAGGVIVVVAGLLRRRPMAAQLALGAGTAIAAVPEGLPLLASIGEAAVARRLAGRRALVRRLGAIEALGRVDVACIDKTGTLTENRLRVQLVAGADAEARLTDDLPEPLRDVVLTAALASPRADSSAAGAHATDQAVIDAGRQLGFADRLDERRAAEAPFDPSRPLHAAVAEDRLCVKGSAEELVDRCASVLGDDGASLPLDDDGRERVLDRAHSFADQGLRVLMVADGDGDGDPSDPGGLRALGFLGIRDSIREGAGEAIERCRTAGIRMIMLTGDHPATARAIADDVGLSNGERVLTGAEIDELDDDELGRALEEASVVARISPLEKVRIVEALRRRGHTVAMTGDGVNDAPALRLADVGVAMGHAGTEVARQAGDLVLADDDLATLADALIEGRTFWANLRRALAMLLGGNLGEVAFITLLSAAGAAAPLTARQVLAVNLVSDVLPALSLVVQSPQRRELGALKREGDAALGAPLRREIAGRAVATSLPAIAAYALVARRPSAQAVGFASIVATQLAQTLDASRSAGGDGRATKAATAASVGFLVAAVHGRGLRTFLGLSPLGPAGWLLVLGAAAASVFVGRSLTR